MRRILRDIATVEVNKELLEAQGIYYAYDDADVTKGTALLVGQPGTPYMDGFFFFSVAFPADYPFSPPTVCSLTQDSKGTRFNPNMYVCGKVCLSILNTWLNGPAWSGVQTLESVLLTIQSAVLNANPIANEPAYCSMEPKDALAVQYNRMLRHAVAWRTAEMLRAPPAFMHPFEATCWRVFLAWRRDWMAALDAEGAEVDGRVEQLVMWRMTVRYDFAGACAALEKLTGPKFECV
jgi:ubiquitin-protein ligase